MVFSPRTVALFPLLQLTALLHLVLPGRAARGGGAQSPAAAPPTTHSVSQPAVAPPTTHSVSQLSAAAAPPTTHSVSQLCRFSHKKGDPLPTEHEASLFYFDFSPLPSNSSVFVCEPRGTETSGILFIQNFLTQEEVALLKEVGLSQFPLDEDGTKRMPGSDGYGMRFMDREEGGRWPRESKEERKLLKNVNKRMDAVVGGGKWRHPYYQFILQDASNKVGKKV